MGGTEGSIGTGIAEIEGELSCLDLNGARRWLQEASSRHLPKLLLRRHPEPAPRFLLKRMTAQTTALAPPGKFLPRYSAARVALTTERNLDGCKAGRAGQSCGTAPNQGIANAHREDRLNPGLRTSTLAMERAISWPKFRAKCRNSAWMNKLSSS